jgi:hypothetical protein
VAPETDQAQRHVAAFAEPAFDARKETPPTQREHFLSVRKLTGKQECNHARSAGTPHFESFTRMVRTRAQAPRVIYFPLVASKTENSRQNAILSPRTLFRFALFHTPRMVEGRIAHAGGLGTCCLYHSPSRRFRHKGAQAVPQWTPVRRRWNPGTGAHRGKAIGWIENRKHRRQDWAPTRPGPCGHDR